VGAVALVGLLINGLTAYLLRHGDELNARAAFLHMVADAAVSAGVAGAGLALWLGGWTWLDPATTLVIAGVVVWSTWGLLREAVGLAGDGVPAHIDAVAVRAFLARQAGVREVHDLHIWPLSTTETALTAHLVRSGGADDGFLQQVAVGLRDGFSIVHATIQVEQGDPGHPCALAPDDVV
jgi:cobalt-zinc-cadmium efflux system protein